MVKFRRTVSFDDDVLAGINHYRAGFLKEGKEKRFGPAVNELLRKTLKLVELAKTALVYTENSKIKLAFQFPDSDTRTEFVNELLGDNQKGIK